MNAVGFLFAFVCSVLLFAAPRRWALLPFLMGTLYMGCFFQMEIGPLHFTVSRVLIAVGFLRIIVKGERIAGGWNYLDRAMVIWAIWAVSSSIFHASGTLIYRFGMVFDTFGVYLLFRVFVRQFEDLVLVCKMICVLLIPLAAAMMFEKLTGKNFFEFLGGTPGVAELRNGHFRARGPFIHQIFAGTVGAVCMPMALVLWRQERKLALAGLAATVVIVVASGSSGPIMTTLSILFALVLWQVRGQLRKIRWLAIFLIIALDIVMKDPVYYLLARIDITGGSTGWHRAALIGAAIKYLNEWWLTGTDVTRHWMPTGIYANANNTDITNYYLAMGVMGGLLLLLLFMWVLFAAFAMVGRALRLNENAPVEKQFLIWTLGAILFGHAITFLSISYFEQQSVVFLYLALAAIGSVCSAAQVESPATADNEQTAGILPEIETSIEHG